MRLVTSAVLVAALLLTSPIYGDGLIYKLPKDGTTVSYKLEMEMGTGDQSRKGGGSLILRSVGKETKDGAKCRWIEFRMEIDVADRKQTILAKLLIPEKELGKGKSPVDHVKKCWLKQRGDAMEVEDVKGNRGGPLPVFLTGPVKGEKKLPAKVVECKLGKLKCVGLQSVKKFKQGSQEMEADIMTRLSDKIPFGVAYQEIKMTVDSGGNNQTVLLKLTAEAVGTGAKSDLPDKT